MDGVAVLLVGLERRRVEPRHTAALPIVQHCAGNGVSVRDAARQELTALAGNLLEEVLGVGPRLDTVLRREVFGLHNLQHGLDHVLLTDVTHTLHTHNALEHGLHVVIGLTVADNTRAVNKEDATCQHNVLPDLCLAGNGGNLADLLATERVDDGALAHVGVADDTDADGVAALTGVLRAGLVRDVVQTAELAEEVDEVAFAEGIRRGAVHRNRRVVLRQDLQPTRDSPRGYEITLVQNKHKVLVALLLADVVLDEAAAGAHRVACVDNVHDDVAGVDDLVQLVPNACALTLLEELALRALVSVVLNLVAGELHVLCTGAVLFGARRGDLLHALELRVHELRALADRLLAERIGELHLVGDAGVVLSVLEETHWELALLEHDGVGVVLLRLHLVTERLKSIRTDHAGVAEPTAVRGDASNGALDAVAGGENTAGDDLARAGIALDAGVVHLQDLDLTLGAQVGAVAGVPTVDVGGGTN
eukprot:PhM_4_TR4484/c1_g1_i1/m.73467